MTRLVAGTRGSALALWQTRWVRARLLENVAGLEVEERIITTQGDINLADRLQGSLEKGFFTQELEAALHERNIHLAVHSLKDLPTRMPPGLTLGAVLKRAAPNDLLLVREDRLGEGELPLAPGSRVGSSSLRREQLVKRYAPSCTAVPLRGNVPTRVEKLKAGQYDAILLAEAGVRRLGLDLAGLAVFQLNPRRWMGAPGQGAVAVQCRADDGPTLKTLRTIDDAPTRTATQLERDFLQVLEGGCTTPFGCYVDGGVAYVGQQIGDGFITGQVVVPPGADAAWIQSQLTRLASATGDEEEARHEWLARRV